MRKRKLREIADIQLRERLQRRREPLRKLSYKEKKRIRERRLHRADLRRAMRESQEPHRDPQTKQAKLGEEPDG